MSRVAIIGAGISGLSCARALQSAGVEVVIFEKSRSYGGRCGSRTFEGAVVDHGAQYFTVRSEAFRRELDSVIPGDWLALANPVIDEHGQPVASGTDRCYVRGGNREFGRALAARLDVRMTTPIEKIVPNSPGWEIGGENFAAVVSCAPWPQTARLLDGAAEENPFAPCLTALFAYRGEPTGRAGHVYAVSDHSGADLAWVACENRKTGRVPSGLTVFVVQASVAFSSQFCEADAADWGDRLQDQLETSWELDRAAYQARFLHRWRFARRVTTLNPSVLPDGFFLCGDSVSESRIEDAWTSGVATAERVLAVIR